MLNYEALAIDKSACEHKKLDLVFGEKKYQNMVGLAESARIVSADRLLPCNDGVGLT